MSNNPSNTIVEYMKTLRNSLMFGRCAGKTTRLSKLHQNRLVCTLVNKEARHRLEKIVRILTMNLKKGYSEDEREINPSEFSLEVQSFLKKIKQYFKEEDIESSSQSTKDFEDRWVDKWKNILGIDMLNLVSEQYAQARSKFENLKLSIQNGKKKGSKSNELIDYDSMSTRQKKVLAPELYDIEREHEALKKKLRRMNKTGSNEFGMDSYDLDDVWKFMTQFEKAIAYADKIHELENDIKSLESKFNDGKKFRSFLNLKNSQEEMNMPEFEYYSFLDKNETLFPNGPGKFLEEFLYGTVSLPSSVEDLRKTDGGLITVFGDPGWGKTIQLRQFTHGFVNEQIQNVNTHNIPIYLKAKTVSKYIKNYASERYGFSIDLPNGGTVSHHGKAVRHVGEVNEICKKAMLETEPSLIKNQIDELFSIQRSVAKNMILIIDAYDEIPSQEARFELVNFLSDQIENHGWPVVMTCRNSHRKELESAFEQMNNHLHAHIKYKIHFTPHELQYVMPTKLANAWGMNSDQISHTVASEFEQFRNVLTHPLFVGLFCMLKSEGAELSVLDIELNSEDRISIHHVSFLKQVIDFGLKINIKDRKVISEEEQTTIRRAFCYIAAIHLTMGINNLDNILTIMEKLHGVRLSEKHRLILAENLGVMFVNGEYEIEWTHKTLPEVAMGLLANEDEAFSEYMDQTYLFGIFGREFEYWTECLFLTLIEDDLMEINESIKIGDVFNKKSIMKKLSHYFGKRFGGTMQQKEMIERSLNLLGINHQIFEEFWFDEKAFYHKPASDDYLRRSEISIDDWRIKTSRGSEFEKELWARIGNSYFQSIIEYTPFALPVQLFGDLFEDRSTEGLLFKFFSIGEIHARLHGIENDILWPKEFIEHVGILLKKNLHTERSFNFSDNHLLEIYFGGIVKDRPFFTEKERRVFARRFKTSLLPRKGSFLALDFIGGEIDYIQLIRVCIQSNHDLALLELCMESYKVHRRYLPLDDRASIDISQIFLSTIDRKDSAPGRANLKWLEKYPCVYGKLCELILNATMGGGEVKESFGIMNDFIRPLKRKWGIPDDFNLIITENSTRFDKINSLDINLMPDSILRYIVSNIK